MAARDPGLQKKLAHLPARPGVYLFKDAGGEILYVGKANSLRSRVGSYFSRGNDHSLKTRELVRRIADVDTIVVGSEAEALLLEANLIKAHHPRFNIQLRDDKRYPYIKVTIQEPLPRLFVTRHLENDGARYFGPFTDVGAVRATLELIKRLYTVRSCRYDLPREKPARPCLDYHIGRCKAPCAALQSIADYRAMFDEILAVLAGRTEHIRARVEAEMTAAADALDFERAANLRDALNGLDALARRQRALDVRGGDQDVLGLARDGDHACAVLLRIRGGKLLGRELDFFANSAEEEESTLLSVAATRLYFGHGDHGTADLPRDVLFPADFEDRPALEQLLSEAAPHRVRTHVPLKGEKRRLIELANQNARHLLEERSVLDNNAAERADDELYELQDALGLKVVPRFIVCFDISHSQGTEVVGSASAFENGAPCKSEYRRFRIRGDWGNDDFRSMAEVVGRYLRRRIDEERRIPDLIVIDGGKGQLSAAGAAARAVGATDVMFCALAKRDEEIYLSGRPTPIRLARSNAGLRLLQRVRDEAHRFAHAYNRKLHTRNALASVLAEVPGVGPARQRALLEHFGSLRAIRAATPERIAELPGISLALAQRIAERLAR